MPSGNAYIDAIRRLVPDKPIVSRVTTIATDVPTTITPTRGRVYLVLQTRDNTVNIGDASVNANSGIQLINSAGRDTIAFYVGDQVTLWAIGTAAVTQLRVVEFISETP